MCATLRRYSKEVSFFWSGYLIGSHSPSTSIPEACISTAWPLPSDSTSLPSTAMQAPVVTFWSRSSGKAVLSTTTCMLLMQEPSFNAMNAMPLLPLFVLTHALASTSAPGSILSRSLTLVLLIVSISVLAIYLGKNTQFPLIIQYPEIHPLFKRLHSIKKRPADMLSRSLFY